MHSKECSGEWALRHKGGDTITIVEKLKKMGYDTIPAEFYGKVDDWKAWYVGDVKKFHHYTVHTGQERVKCRRLTLGMANHVSADWANLLMNEKVKITLESEKEQAFVDSVFQSNNFDVKSNEMQEMKSALGTVAYIPRVADVSASLDGVISASGDAKIKLDYVTIEHIFPISWENGVVTECAFTSDITVDGDKYLYMQIHKLENGKYIIKNSLFKNKNDQLADMTADEMHTVRGFESIPEIVRTNWDKRQFVIDRLNIANNYDVSLPVGVPVFANAIDVLQGVDKAFDSYVNEFVLGKKRIMVKPAAAGSFDGEPYFDPADTTYYVLPEDTADGNIIQPIDFTMRTQEFSTGLQDQLNMLSMKCGFGEAHYRFENGGVTTATQVVSENSTMFRTIKKHEIILESVLVELCRIILHLGNSVMGAGLNEDVEISIDFDDSIIEDKETDFNRDSRLVQMGVMNAWEFRAKWMNEDETTAKAALPKMDALMEVV